MKTLMIVAALILTSAAPRPAHAADAMQAVVSSYLEIHAQLTADKFDGMSEAANKIVADAAALPSGGADIVKAAKALQQSKDLNAARERFGTLSDAVIAAAKAEGWKGLDDVKLGYCPMVKRSWIQKEDKIRNPYGMLTCGVFKDKS